MSPASSVLSPGGPGKPCVRLSWSGLKRYENCPQHHLRTIAGQTKSIQDGRIFFEGNVLDRAQRQYLDNPFAGMAGQPTLDDLVKVWFKRLSDPQDEEFEYVIRWRGDSREDARKALEKCLAGAAALQPLLERHVLPYAWEPEKRFKTWIGLPAPPGVTTPDGRIGCQLTGGIDIVVYDKATGDFTLLDLKTTTNAAYMQKTLGQAVFYDIAWGSYWGDMAQPTRFGFLAPLVSPDVIWATISNDDRRAMMARIVKASHGMVREQWQPKTDDVGCTWCEANSVCPKFALATQRDAWGANRVDFGAAARSRAEVETVDTREARA